eukprot:TRINITY_DN9348_c0_g1_i1.p1 TRINITY_DN9348_c0_g1~~TRINITY_DN9348_c0_g1_i1.p1  ORF type:complete len:286 (+),score=59.17 TRINITY_DN9348_c0_g1_i1:3-860(+)
MIVFVVVFLKKRPKYQLCAAMWVIAVFIFLNIFMRPYKYRVLWVLENVSHISICTTLNLGLFYLEDTAAGEEAAVAAGVLSISIAVLLVFVWQICKEAKREVVVNLDRDGDGAVSMEEVTTYVMDIVKRQMPEYLQSKQKEMERKIRVAWNKNEGSNEPTQGVAREYGYWMDRYGKIRKNRFAALQSYRKQEVETKIHGQKATEEDMHKLWPVCFGELSQPTKEPSSPDNESLEYTPKGTAPENPLRFPLYELASSPETDPRRYSGLLGFTLEASPCTSPSPNAV